MGTEEGACPDCGKVHVDLRSKLTFHKQSGKSNCTATCKNIISQLGITPEGAEVTSIKHSEKMESFYQLADENNERDGFDFRKEDSAKGITKTNGNADKSNIRWCLHIQGVHAKGACSIIKNGTTVESETDFTTNATQADLDSKSYLYADAEIDGSSNKLTILFSKYLAGKKVQVEAFRETPSIIQPPNLGMIKSVTIKAKENQY